MKTEWYGARLRRRRFLEASAAAGVGATGLALVGCGDDDSGASKTSSPGKTATAQNASSVASATPKTGGTLTIVTALDEPRLDPGKMTLNSDETYLLYNTLIEYDSEGKLIPGLATSWETPDAKTVILHLRPGVKYHDGTDFKAADVKWNMERHRKFKTAAAGDLAKIENIDVSNDQTVTLHLSQPFAPMVELLTQAGGVMASPTALGDKTPDEGNQSPVGTGPFKLDKWTVGAGKELSRNQAYWDKGFPYLDKWSVAVVPEYASEIANFESGKALSMLDVRQGDAKSIQDKGFRCNPNPTGWYWALRLNCKAPQLQDKRVRQAIAQAIDRAAIVKALDPLSPVGEGIFGPGFGQIYDPAFKSPLQYSPSDAKKLLDAAGVGSGFEFELMKPSSPTGKRETEAIGAQLAQVGIKAKFWEGDLAAGAQKLYSKDFQGLFTANVPNPVAPYFRIDQAFLSDGSRNYENYSNAEVDRILKASLAATSQQQRIDAYRQVQPLIADDASTIVVFYEMKLQAWAKSVRNAREWVGGIPRYTDVWLA